MSGHHRADTNGQSQQSKTRGESRKVSPTLRLKAVVCPGPFQSRGWGTAQEIPWCGLRHKVQEPPETPWSHPLISISKLCPGQGRVGSGCEAGKG